MNEIGFDRFRINKEQLKQKNIEYKELNKEKIKEKKNAPFTCVCGCVIKYSHKSQHEKNMLI